VANLPCVWSVRLGADSWSAPNKVFAPLERIWESPITENEFYKRTCLPILSRETKKISTELINLHLSTQPFAIPRRYLQSILFGFIKDGCSDREEYIKTWQGLYRIAAASGTDASEVGRCLRQSARQSRCRFTDPLSGTALLPAGSDHRLSGGNGGVFTQLSAEDLCCRRRMPPQRVFAEIPSGNGGKISAGKSLSGQRSRRDVRFFRCPLFRQCLPEILRLHAFGIPHFGHSGTVKRGRVFPSVRSTRQQMPQPLPEFEEKTQTKSWIPASRVSGKENSSICTGLAV